MEVYENFDVYCKDFIKNHIEDHLGRTVYACDFASDITMGINVDGSATYSTYKAKEYLKTWWDEAADYFQYEKDNFGENHHNPFENPEAYMVCMIITGVGCLMAQVKEINEAWNDHIEVTQELCDSICKQLDDIEMYNCYGYVKW